ncbi:hypothetical protein GH153_04565 [bacterium]|nr:hypothetical protein [bacterium]
MRILGLVLLIGGFLVRILTHSPSMDIIAWVLMGLGVVIVIISYLTKKK